MEDEVRDLEVFLRARVADQHTDYLSIACFDELIVIALLSSGLRNSEFCSLTMGDTVLGTGASVFVVRQPPTRARTVYIPRRVSTLVEGYAHHIRPRRIPDGLDPDDPGQPLLLNEHCRPFDRTGLYRRVVKILTAAGLGDRANVQLLRHTYGYLAYLRTGGNLLFVQRQLGHAHPATTSIYAKLVDESYGDLAERILPGECSAAALGTKTHASPASRFDCEID